MRIYTAMVRLQTLDTVFYDAQRQVRRRCLTDSGRPCMGGWLSPSPVTTEYAVPRLCRRGRRRASVQGRFSFYMTSNGEEATAIGSAAALTLEDTVRLTSLTCGCVRHGPKIHQHMVSCYGSGRWMHC